LPPIEAGSAVKPGDLPTASERPLADDALGSPDRAQASPTLAAPPPVRPPIPDLAILASPSEPVASVPALPPAGEVLLAAPGAAPTARPPLSPTERERQFEQYRHVTERLTLDEQQIVREYLRYLRDIPTQP